MLQNDVKTPAMLVILDGFGFSKDDYGNAIVHAAMPVWQKLLKKYPHTLLQAAGHYVGLPDGFIGNSEVGHLTIGAGRVVASVLKRFDDAIDHQTFFENKMLKAYFAQLKKSGKALHLMGLLSDGGVHSHEKHLYALLTMACHAGLTNIFIHPFLDGRDVLPTSASVYLERLQKLCVSLRCGKIASMHGRFYAMDRDNNWDRTKITYDILMGKEKPINLDWQAVLTKSYQQGITDEFIEPVLLDAQGVIRPGDGVIFFNFRPDRARQLTECFIESSDAPANSLAFFITITRFKETFTNPILFQDSLVEHTLLDVLAAQEKKVFIIAETEKYAHVTYFFRGMRDVIMPCEERVLVPSLKARTYEQNPAMSAPAITQRILASLQADPAYFYLVNYANADMVGHSGSLQAAVKACECLDEQLGKLYQAVVEERGGILFITADHGNAEQLIDPQTRTPHTAHTMNPVPFVACGKEYEKVRLGEHRGLAGIAPTVLKHLGINIPDEMEKPLY